MTLATVLASARGPESSPVMRLRIPRCSSSGRAGPICDAKKPMSLLASPNAPRPRSAALPHGLFVVYMSPHAVGTPVALGHLWRQDTRGGAPMQLTLAPAAIRPAPPGGRPTARRSFSFAYGQIYLLPAEAANRAR